MGKVFVLGSLNIDITLESDYLPKNGETVIGRNSLISPGGKGGNQAVACAKQGVETIMLGSIGSDSFSKTLKEGLIEYGINCNYLREVEDINCGMASIWLVDKDNRIIIDQGANLVHDIDTIINALRKEAKPNDILISQLEIPVEVVEKVFKEAKSLGLKTILNPAPACLLSDELYNDTDILIPNESEIYNLTNVKPTNEKNINKSAKILLKKGVNEVILTSGSTGCYYININFMFKVNSYQVDVVDTTAAGDTFIGVLASEIIKDKSLRDAMKRASAASALTIQKKGAQVSIPSFLK